MIKLIFLIAFGIIACNQMDKKSLATNTKQQDQFLAYNEGPSVSPTVNTSPCVIITAECESRTGSICNMVAVEKCKPPLPLYRTAKASFQCNPDIACPSKGAGDDDTVGGEGDIECTTTNGPCSGGGGIYSYMSTTICYDSSGNKVSETTKLKAGYGNCPVPVRRTDVGPKNKKDALGLRASSK